MKNLCPTLILILALLACGCKKDIDTIGLNLQDGTLGNAYTEIPLTAHSSIEDSLFTKNLLYTLLGENKDPVFGTTGAGFCAQFALQGSNTSFGYLVHALGSDLNFHPFLSWTQHSDVQALVAVRLGHREPVAHTLGV